MDIYLRTDGTDYSQQTLKSGVIEFLLVSAGCLTSVLNAVEI